jgi:hypothetical protein
MDKGGELSGKRVGKMGDGKTRHHQDGNGVPRPNVDHGCLTNDTAFFHEVVGGIMPLPSERSDNSRKEYGPGAYASVGGDICFQCPSIRDSPNPSVAPPAVEATLPFNNSNITVATMVREESANDIVIPLELPQAQEMKFGDQNNQKRKRESWHVLAAFIVAGLAIVAGSIVLGIYFKAFFMIQRS